MLVPALALLAASRQAPVAELPFEMVNNHIYVPASVNGNQTFAVIDSGAGMSVMDSQAATDWKLPSSGNLRANGIGKESVQGQFLTGATITFGGISQPMGIAIPLASLATAEGRPMQAIVGYEFFKKYLVQIDYPNRRLRAYPPTTTLSGGAAFPMHIVGNHPHITTELVMDGKSYKLETMIDTGASGGGLSAKFLKDHPVTTPTTPKVVIGGGVGGFIEGRFFRPDALKIGSYTAAKPVMTLTDAEGGASGANSSYDLLLGADILSRFKVTFDYAHSQVIFEPAAELSKPFEADKTGLRIYAEGPDWNIFRIVGVMKDSAGEAAGLQVGDFIETVDGEPASKFKLYDLRKRFRAADAKGWELGVKRGDQHLNVKVQARAVI